MAPGLWAIAVMAFSVGLSVTSCAYHPRSDTPMAIKKDLVQPNLSTGQQGREGKHVSAMGSDSDCVLATGDIHLWCSWITQYY